MEDKKHSFMDQLNLFFVGAVIGAIIGTCFGMNVYKGKSIKAEKKLKAYEEYYKCTETLLDSLECRYFGCWGHVPINCYFKLVK